MIRKIQRRWFEVWADAEAQNNILKYLLLLFTVVCASQLVMIGCLSFKKPLIISVGNETVPMEQKEPTTDALIKEIARAIKKYLEQRHNWNWLSVETNIKRSSNYVASDFREKFLIRSTEQIRIAKEKQVTQKLFAEEPKVDLKERRATVVSERVLIVSGIHAAQEMIFEITFASGARTIENPEGIYVVSEELQTAKP